MSAINGVSRSWGREGVRNKRGLELQRNSLWLRHIIKSEVAGTLDELKDTSLYSRSPLASLP